MMESSAHSDNESAFTLPFDDGADVVLVDEEDAQAATFDTDQAATTMTTAPEGNNGDEPEPADYTFYHSVRRHPIQEVQPTEPAIDTLAEEKETKQSIVAEAPAEEKKATPPASPSDSPSKALSPPRSDLLEPPSTVLIDEMADEYVEEPAGNNLFDSEDLATVESQTIFIPATEEHNVSPMASPSSASELSLDVDDATTSEDMFKGMEENSLLTNAKEDNAAMNEQEAMESLGELEYKALVPIGETMLHTKAQPDKSTDPDPKLPPMRPHLMPALVIGCTTFGMIWMGSRSVIKQATRPSHVGLKQKVHKPTEEYIDIDELEAKNISFQGASAEKTTDDQIAPEEDLDRFLEETDAEFSLREFNASAGPTESIVQDENTDVEHGDLNVGTMKTETFTAFVPTYEEPSPKTTTSHSKTSLFAWVSILVTIFLSAYAYLWMCSRGSSRRIETEAEPANKAAPGVAHDNVPAVKRGGGKVAYPLKWLGNDGEWYEIDSQNYLHLRVVDLRDELRRRSCSPSGRKADLLVRLVKSYQEELSSLAYKDLQGRLKRAGLKQTGKTKVLIVRLLEAGL